jgi:hypothetical protein
MKKQFLILLLVLSTNLTFGQEFLGIKVDGKLNDVVEKFKLKGLKVTDGSTPNVKIMEGFVGDRNLEVYIKCTPTTKTVWGFTVYLPKQTVWSSLKREYEEYLDLLSKKYGEPDKKYNFFSSPYEEGDGDEMTAVAVDKCRYASFWTETLGIQISKYKQVVISYENKTNAELNRKEKDEIKEKIF